MRTCKPQLIDKSGPSLAARRRKRRSLLHQAVMSLRKCKPKLPAKLIRCMTQSCWRSRITRFRQRPCLKNSKRPWTITATNLQASISSWWIFQTMSMTLSRKITERQNRGRAAGLLQQPTLREVRLVPTTLIRQPKRETGQPHLSTTSVSTARPPKRELTPTLASPPPRPTTNLN